jgi:transposase InsO family protein
MRLSIKNADRSGTQYCGSDGHEYELYLVEDIDHTRSKAKSPQTNGMCERFHKTVLNEFYRVAFVKDLQNSRRTSAIWTSGLSCTMKNDLIRGDGATGKLLCRRSSTACRWLKKK